MQQKIDAFLLRLNIKPDQIWHSPALRCQQTAEVMGEDFSVVPQPEFSLSEMFDEIDIVNKLAEVPSGSTIALITHGPEVVRFSTFCVGKSVMKSLPLHNSGVAIEFTDKVASGKGRFVRLISIDDISL